MNLFKDMAINELEKCLIEKEKTYSAESITEEW